MLFSHQMSLNRKQFLQQEKEYLELKQCTFAPKIKNHDRKRSFKKFYDQELQFVNKKEEKLRTLRANKSKKITEDEKCLMNKITMSSGSKRILDRLNKAKDPVNCARNNPSFKHNPVSICRRIGNSFVKPALQKSAKTPPLLQNIHFNALKLYL